MSGERESPAHGLQPATLGEALEVVHEQLAGADLCYGHGTDNAWDEAVLLLLTACGEAPDAPEDVLQAAMPPGAWATASDWLGQRIQKRTPLPYLLGRAWYAGLEFRCDRRALVPRSPLAELILDDFEPWWTGEPPRTLLDLCCGGGCIGIAAAVHHGQLEVLLADVDADALELAVENIALHGVQNRVATCRSDLFGSLAGRRFDIILANPPYVNAQDLAAMPEEYRAEPAGGLGSGEDGLDIARRILRDAQRHLSARGLLFLELGNSWVALDEALASLPLTWLEFSRGGHGVLMLRRDELPAVVAALP